MVIIREYKDSDLQSLNKLLLQVYSHTREGITTKENIELVATIDNNVVGYLVLNKIYNTVENNYYGHINYVCVLEQYRNQGIATKLFKEVFKICKEKDIVYLELTSNQSRVAAHYLYQKLGFNIRKTDVFRIPIA